MAQKICLIDGSGYIFRAFYGLPPLTAPDGTPVNAVYGFTNMFLKLTTKIPCDYCLVLFDAKRQNFRNDIFAAYKGTRKETPEELIPQFPLIREAVDVLNISFLEMEGFEADDLIATYTAQALAKGLEVVVVSGDKDLMQLIRPGVEFYDPMKDKFFTPEDVREKFGVYPDKVVDVQALSGDSIDNVPGVPGIGPKTAAQLINEYGSVENLLVHAGEIKQEKRRQAILDNAENARISLKLVTLKADVPVERKLTEFHCRCPEADRLNAFIDKYGFNSLKARVGRWLAERCTQIEQLPPAEIVKQYHLVNNDEALKNMAARLSSAGRFSLAVVSDGINPVFDRLVAVAFSPAPGEAYYIPLSNADRSENMDLFTVAPPTENVSDEAFIRYVYPLLADKSILKIGHDLKYAMHFITRRFGETSFAPYDDVAVISYCLDSSEHGHELNTLAALFLDEKLPALENLLGSGKNKISFAALDGSVAANYLAGRADYGLRLYDVLKERLAAEKRLSIYENFDRPLVQTLYNMENRGIKVNARELKNLSAYFEF